MKNLKSFLKPYSSFRLSLLIFASLIAVLLIISLIMDNIDRSILSKSSPFFYIIISLLTSQIIATIVYSFYSKRISKLTKEFIDAFSELSNGNFNVRIKNEYDGILNSIKEKFNSTIEELNNIETIHEDFTRNFSHEFKTPIVSIMGFAKLLKNPCLSEKEKLEYIDIIIEESNRLVMLSSNTLTLTNLENQSIIHDKTNFDLNEQIRQSVLILENKWLEKNIQIELNLNNDLIFSGNKQLLQEVWLNVIGNAIKFSNKNSKITIDSMINNSNQIQIDIIDEGIGMNAETLKHIFDKYYQGDKSHSVSGNGLGLAITKKIIYLHNGSIKVTSSINKGSTFSIIF